MGLTVRAKSREMRESLEHVKTHKISKATASTCYNAERRDGVTEFCFVV
jgi:hypothetical protein